MTIFFKDKLPKKPNGELIPLPVIPGKSGNYKEESGIYYYKFIIDGESYLSPFRVASILGIQIKDYMDLLEIIQKNPDKYGHIELVRY
jgi:hypothetical protein